MRTGGFLRWVAHPLTVGATVVLLLNDHVFKQAWPGLVTGKLSDVAGLVVAPPVLGLLVSLFLADRIAAGVSVLLTGAGFAVVKLTPAGAEVASAAWSVVNGPSGVLADPADLVALPALGLAWWAWRRVSAAPPLPDGLVSRVRVLVAVPFAVLAIAATSAPGDTVPSVDSVTGADEGGTRVMIQVDRRTYTSASGVGDWTPVPETPESLLTSPPQRQRKTEACVPDDPAHCYRVHGGGDLSGYAKSARGGRLLGVDETTDNGRTWRTAWEVPAARWPFVLSQHRFPRGFERPGEVASVEVLVRAVPGGHEVFVANGAEGLAVCGVDGTWRRVPVVVAETGLEIRPVPLTAFGHGLGEEIIDAGLIALLALLIGVSVAAGRARARTGYGLVAVLPAGLLLVGAVPLTAMVSFFSNSTATIGLGLVVALFQVIAGTGLTMTVGVLRRSRVLVVGAAAVLTGLAFLGPVFGWTAGQPTERDPAIGLGLVLAAVSLVLVVAAGWWAGRDPVQRPVPKDPGWPPLPSPR
ncbi:hypothetical protein SAMN04488074_12013 [Lentzea albidocapillata subsp. violacea]|uniref:Uncharacterized protein n=1 Tax=Lentzea albidocapillata subsp. violacea TaxID=128104 RepID=A0A1G9SD60_9PSEU|nr:hypothetical protein [Lentzea albidocapillata]SDM33267.1 hypothetical protein SAMN04488074_12013 [Lentzea albidocapillata subsp. violacea]